MNSDVRTAKTGDARAIARIHAASWRVTYRGMLPEAYLASLLPARLEAGWRRRLSHPAEQVLVAEVGKVVGGFATIGEARVEDDPGFAGELFMLYIDPACEGAGLGTLLIEDAERRLAAAGCRWMVIWVVAANQRALDFYTRAGFRDDGGRRTDRLGGGRTPVVRLGKAIGEPIAVPGL